MVWRLPLRRSSSGAFGQGAAVAQAERDKKRGRVMRALE